MAAELGAPSWIQTSDLRLRRAALCSAELPEQSFPSALTLQRAETRAAGWTRTTGLSIIGRVLSPAKLQQQISSLSCWCKDSNLDRAPIQGSQHCPLCYTSQSGPGGWIPTSDLGVRTAPLCSLSYARSEPGTAGGTLTPDLRVRSAALYTSKLQRPETACSRKDSNLQLTAY